MKPVVTSARSPISRIAQFLNKILRSVIRRHAQPTSFINGADFMRKLHRYTVDEHQLRPETIFATVDITNFYTMASNANLVMVLEGFLNDTMVIPVVDGLPVRKILALTSLFLNNNIFYYDNNIYQFKKGGPSSSPLFETLCAIYALRWQKFLLKEPSFQKEFYGW